MTGLGYTVPATAAVVIVCVWEAKILHTGLFRKLGYWLTMLIVLAFQILVDGWLTKSTAPIVLYEPRHNSGISIPWDIPVEDFLFGFAMVTATLLLWERQRRSSSALSDRTESPAEGTRDATQHAATAFHDQQRFGFADPLWALIGMYTRGRLLCPPPQPLRSATAGIRMPAADRHHADQRRQRDDHAVTTPITNPIDPKSVRIQRDAVICIHSDGQHPPTARNQPRRCSLPIVRGGHDGDGALSYADCSVVVGDVDAREPAALAERYDVDNGNTYPAGYGLQQVHLELGGGYP